MNVPCLRPYKQMLLYLTSICKVGIVSKETGAASVGN